MAWDDELPIIARALLQDKGASVVYSDATLVEMLLLAAMKVKNAYDFEAAYTVRIEDEILTPDPTATATRDEAFILLVCYTAVVDFIRAEVRSTIRQGIRIKDGDSELDLRSDSSALKLLLDEFRSELDAAVLQNAMGGALGFGEAIVGVRERCDDRCSPFHDRRCP